MIYTNITFLSSRKRGMNIDMKLIKDYLERTMDHINFRYFLESELNKNYMVKMGRQAAKKNFIHEKDNVICIDGSLTNDLGKGEGKRILLALPFGYQFEKAISREENPDMGLLNNFKGFNYILSPSPFTSDILRKIYKLDGIKLIENVYAPFTWQISRPKFQEEVKDQFSVYYPSIKGKKTLSILTTGKLEENKKNWCENFNLEDLLKNLGEEWFVFTNDSCILEQAVMLPARYINSFGYINHVYPPRNLLYFSDILVTNSSIYATYFVPCKKPVYCLKYNDNCFEQYIAKHHPDIYLKSLEELEELPYKKENSFMREFLYETGECAEETIRKILSDQI